MVADKRLIVTLTARARLRDGRSGLTPGPVAAEPHRPGYGQVVPTRLACDLIPASIGAAADFAVVALGL